MENIKKKPDLGQIIRHSVQIVCFALAPGLFISIFSAFRIIIRALVTFTFSWDSVVSSALLLLLVLPLTALMGRFFCSYMCAFGTMQEFLWIIADKLHIHNNRPLSADKLDKYLKYLKYVVLGVIVVLFWIIGSDLGSRMDPWSVFGLYTSLSGWKTLAPLISLSGLMLLLIMLLSVFVQRGFCRYLCPLGAVFSAVSGARLVRVKRNTSWCSECGMCSRACIMGVDMSCRADIRSGECINCFRCVGSCPEGNLSENSKKALAAGLAATMITAAGCSAVNALGAKEYTDNTAASQAEREEYGDYSYDTDDSYDGNKSSESSASDVMNGTYDDGVYTGTGQGFRGDITVQVTVSGGKITDIELLSSNDDQQFFNRAWSSVISYMTGSQSTDADTVTGATFSSNGIIEAVKNALGEQYTNPNGSMERGHGGHEGGGFHQDNGFDREFDMEDEYHHESEEWGV